MSNEICPNSIVGRHVFQVAWHEKGSQNGDLKPIYKCQLCELCACVDAKNRITRSGFGWHPYREHKGERRSKGETALFAILDSLGMKDV